MATQQPSFNVGTFVAGADLSANQFQGVKLSAGKWVLATAAGERLAGILQNKPKLDEEADVAGLGVVKWKASAAITAFDPLATTATGTAKTAVAASVNTSDAGVVADPVVGSYVMGIALEAAAAANELISVLLVPMGAVPTTAA